MIFCEDVYVGMKMRERERDSGLESWIRFGARDLTVKVPSTTNWWKFSPCWYPLVPYTSDCDLDSMSLECCCSASIGCWAVAENKVTSSVGHSVGSAAETWISMARCPDSREEESTWWAVTSPLVNESIYVSTECQWIISPFAEAGSKWFTAALHMPLL